MGKPPHPVFGTSGKFGGGSRFGSGADFGGSSGTPPATSDLLLEDGFALLTEAGDKILLET